MNLLNVISRNYFELFSKVQINKIYNIYIYFIKKFIKKLKKKD